MANENTGLQLFVAPTVGEEIQADAKYLQPICLPDGSVRLAPIYGKDLIKMGLSPLRARITKAANARYDAMEAAFKAAREAATRAANDKK